MKQLVLVMVVVSWQLAVLLPARARPADRVVFLEPGQLKFEQAARGSWQVESTAPEIVRARFFPAGEVQLQAGKTGRALVLLDNRKIGEFRVWQVVVGKPGSPEKPDAAALATRCACRPDEEVGQLCTVKDTACLDFLGEYFSSHLVSSSQVGVVYTVASAQLLLRRMSRQLAKDGFSGVDLAFWGANLRVKARVGDEAERRRLLLAVWRYMVGRLVLDDAIEVGSTTR
ncbi:MAG: hypothetical protein DRI34_07830 [Deltaproteobacteria bacterium]|nr:MAG: hypothetical protein DRI34_07830 [Deltaproteobacteria bacterium]